MVWDEENRNGSFLTLFQALCVWCEQRACHSTGTRLRREIYTSSLKSNSLRTTGSVLRNLRYDGDLLYSWRSFSWTGRHVAKWGHLYQASFGWAGRTLDTNHFAKQGQKWVHWNIYFYKIKKCFIYPAGIDMFSSFCICLAFWHISKICRFCSIEKLKREKSMKKCKSPDKLHWFSFAFIINTESRVSPYYSDLPETHQLTWTSWQRACRSVSSTHCSFALYPSWL